MEKEVEVEISVKGKKIKIRGSNLKTILSQLDDEVTKSVENILAKLEPVKSQINSNSLQALIKELKPKSFYDKILTCIYYLHTQGTKTFNQNDIREAFVEALFPLPKNIVDLLNKLQKKGFLAEHTEKKDGLKSWYITQEGLDYVQKGFEEVVK
jgi:hypothetical protein